MAKSKFDPAALHSLLKEISGTPSVIEDQVLTAAAQHRNSLFYCERFVFQIKEKRVRRINNGGTLWSNGSFIYDRNIDTQDQCWFTTREAAVAEKIRRHHYEVARLKNDISRREAAFKRFAKKENL